MIHPDTLTFLKDLSKNNSKEWFDNNRKRYQQVRDHFIQLTEILINELAHMDPLVGYPDPKKCIFRINRDIRFSPDKSPYKTNMGAYISEGGKNSFLPGYYIHVEPGNCFAAGGMYVPPSNLLKSIRNRIYDDPQQFRDIIEEPAFKKIFPELYGEKLKTAPRGFPKDHPDIDLLRYKSYTVFRAVSDELITSPDALEVLMDTYKTMKPFNDYLRETIKDVNSAS